jgi:hypothetical protein
MYPRIRRELVADPLGSMGHTLGIISFAGQHWLRERASVLRYSHVPCLVLSHYIHIGCEVLSVNVSNCYSAMQSEANHVCCLSRLIKN